MNNEKSAASPALNQDNEQTPLQSNVPMGEDVATVHVAPKFTKHEQRAKMKHDDRCPMSKLGHSERLWNCICGLIDDHDAARYRFLRDAKHIDIAACWL